MTPRHPFSAMALLFCVNLFVVAPARAESGPAVRLLARSLDGQGLGGDGLLPSFDLGLQVTSEGGLTPCALSLIPGLGQFFNGDHAKAVGFFLVVTGGYVTTLFLDGTARTVVGLTTFALHVLAFVDAYLGGALIGGGDGGDVGLPARPVITFASPAEAARPLARSDH